MAAGARVVSSPVNLFRSGWPAVTLTDPTATAFAAAIRAGLDAPVAAGDIPSLNDYDWAVLADRFDQCLRRAAVRG